MNLPFESDHFDYATMALVLFFVPDPAVGVAEMMTTPFLIFSDTRTPGPGTVSASSVIFSPNSLATRRKELEDKKKGKNT